MAGRRSGFRAAFERFSRIPGRRYVPRVSSRKRFFDRSPGLVALRVRGRSRAEPKAKRELAGRETRFLAAGDPDRADSAAFFRTIDARQNFRPSLSSSLYFLPSSPFLVLPFFAMEGEKAARRAYVTLHLHNAAANCQCGRQLRK